MCMRHMVRMDEQMNCRNSEFLLHFTLGAESLKPFLKVFQGNKKNFNLNFFGGGCPLIALIKLTVKI